MARGGIFSIQRFSLHDGDGIRTTVFLKGCPLSCAWCHNPESQSVAPERIYRAERCLLCARCVDACEHGALSVVGDRLQLDRTRCIDAGACALVCPTGATELVGRDWDVAEVVRVVRRDVPFYDESGGGVTFSGGEPLHQPEFLEGLLRACREEGIRTTVDTSGHAPPEVVERVVPLCDGLLFDVKHTVPELHQHYTGVTNEQILDNLARVRRITRDTGASLRVRVPLVAGVNDGAEDARRVAELLASLDPPPPVDLMPYLEFGNTKYERLGRPVPGFAAPSDERRNAFAALLQGAGLEVTIRGEIYEHV
ncbi:MAG: glycyl-radical enzyme activating protein [Gemmatimonadetes bacterium]|nr:glycyl-radical enzyme activating protein [Gemmatimonadota bacterium]